MRVCPPWLQGEEWLSRDWVTAAVLSSALLIFHWCAFKEPGQGWKSYSYCGWMLKERGKREVGKCYVATQPSACHKTWSVLSTGCRATVLPAPRFLQKIYPRATIEPGAQKWEHYVLLSLFYLNELVQWSQLWVLRNARVIFVLLPSENMWSKCNLFTAWT